jgi:hypothetical protein
MSMKSARRAGTALPYSINFIDSLSNVCGTMTFKTCPPPRKKKKKKKERLMEGNQWELFQRTLRAERRISSSLALASSSAALVGRTHAFSALSSA